MVSNSIIKQLTQAAIKALIYEVSLTPKPGLVDRNNNGSHNDMDFYTFIDSSFALEPFFESYAQAGLNHRSSMKHLFIKLRRIGIEAERAMFKATNQVNTHKGANFSLAILLGATAYHLRCSDHELPLTIEDVERILLSVQQMVEEPMLADFEYIKNKSYNTLTNGERLYRDYGITGVRGEAMAGYPTLINRLIPFFNKHTDGSFEWINQKALVYLMSITEDSNLLHRGGYQKWKKVQKHAKSLTTLFDDEQQFMNELIKFDQQLIAQNLSPGGSADMLILGLYFGILMNIFKRPTLL